jgi:aspartate carbamoyltransferase catalytic subunit/NAD(P)H-flavin reductase
MTHDPSSSRAARRRRALRHLITLEGLSAAEMTGLLNLAQFYLREPAICRPAIRVCGDARSPTCSSSRARAPRVVRAAALRLGADVVNLDMQSVFAGEGRDGARHDLHAAGHARRHPCDARRRAGLPAYVAKFVAPHISILNAGEAHLSHPTQGLLDALTVRQMKGDFAPLRVLIAGDISHSRVARSAWQAFTTLGVAELRIAAPDDLMPGPGEFAGAKRFTDIDRAIDGVDVVMTLRIQRERMRGAHLPDDAAYHRAFGITTERMKKARPGAIVMHPGPMNRDVEIASEVADGPQSVIQRQVANGVAIRMACSRPSRATCNRAGISNERTSKAPSRHDLRRARRSSGARALRGRSVRADAAGAEVRARRDAGSFVHLSCDEQVPMRRPLSIMRAHPERGSIEVLYKIVGPGLARSRQRRVGEAINALGPIGNGFVPHRERPRTLLVGGGVGIPPMVFLAERLREDTSTPWQPLVLMGSEIPFPFRARPSTILVPGMPEGVIACMPLLDEWGIPSRLTSLAGYAGCHEGYVTDLAATWLASLDRAALSEVEMFACGPDADAEGRCCRGAHASASRARSRWKSSWRAPWADARDAPVKVMTANGPAMKRVCVDGPVFEAKAVYPESG